MKTALYKQTGEKAGETELPEKIFGLAFNHDFVHHVVTMQSSRRRQVSANAKTRGEVSGGGKKPWPQKHTGRARHGSTRSPIWVGGGVTHGPRAERVFGQKVNKKMRRKALRMALAEKARQDLLIVLQDWNAEGGKTKALGSLLRKLPCDKKRTLIILPEMNKDFIRAANNLAFAKTAQARELNALDVLSAKYIVMPEVSLRVIEETLEKQK